MVICPICEFDMERDSDANLDICPNCGTSQPIQWDYHTQNDEAMIRALEITLLTAANALSRHGINPVTVLLEGITDEKM